MRNIRDKNYLRCLEEVRILKSYLYMTGEKVEFTLRDRFHKRELKATLYCDEEMNFILEIPFINEKIKDEKIKTNIDSMSDFWWINRVEDLEESKSTKYPKSFSNKWSEILAEYRMNASLNHDAFSIRIRKILVKIHKETKEVTYEEISNNFTLDNLDDNVKKTFEVYIISEEF